MRLRSSVVEVKELTPRDRLNMFALMQKCFENIQSEAFEADLNAKWLVVQVHDPASGKLVGFSTQVMLRALVGKTPIQALFSGDTVVLPSHWGDPALAHEWGQLALQLIDKHESERLYWFLTSKGFRTYRYLPLFFRQYYPKVNEKPKVSEKHNEYAAAIHAFGQLVGGSRYDPVRQIIQATPAKDYVRRGISEPGTRAHRDPHVRFFLDQNPGYAQGDELCCLAPLSRENFTRAAFRVINANLADREAV